MLSYFVVCLGTQSEVISHHHTIFGVADLQSVLVAGLLAPSLVVQIISVRCPWRPWYVSRLANASKYLGLNQLTLHRNLKCVGCSREKASDLGFFVYHILVQREFLCGFMLLFHSNFSLMFEEKKMKQPGGISAAVMLISFTKEQEAMEQINQISHNFYLRKVEGS